MGMLGAPSVTRIELFADTDDFFARRHSLSYWRSDFIIVEPWSLFVGADERLRGTYGCQAEHR
jgi:hypothetical protein